MDATPLKLTAILPFEISISPSLKLLFIACFGILAISFLLRVIFGNHSVFVQALRATAAIIPIYSIAVLLFKIAPAQFSGAVTALPFLQIFGSTLNIISLQSVGFKQICENIVTLYILSFFANLFVSTMPQGKSFIKKLVRFVLSFVLAYVTYRITTYLLHTYLPDLLTSYGPIILLGIMVAMFISGAVGLLLGLVLATVNPILGGICTFFFSRTVGRYLTKTIITTMLFVALIGVLSQLGYGYI